MGLVAGQPNLSTIMGFKRHYWNQNEYIWTLLLIFFIGFECKCNKAASTGHNNSSSNTSSPPVKQPGLGIEHLKQEQRKKKR